MDSRALIIKSGVGAFALALVCALAFAHAIEGAQALAFVQWTLSAWMIAVGINASGNKPQ